MTITPTTPASTPLDTLKALVLRTRSELDYVLDQLGGCEANVPEEILDFLSGTNEGLYDYLNEHIPLDVVEAIPGVPWRKPSAATYFYDDGTHVVEFIESEGMTSSFFPRYDGSRHERVASHHEAVAAMHRGWAEDASADQQDG